MKLIKLTKGYISKIDNNDFINVSKYKWYFSGGYAGHDLPTKKRILLHRFVIGAKNNQEVDHINGDKLDNRKKNLRFCTRSQNNFNQGLQRTNKSGFKGVSWDEKNKKWRAQIHLNNKAKNLGRFKEKEDAAKAYNKAAKILFKEFANLNKI